MFHVCKSCANLLPPLSHTRCSPQLPSTLIMFWVEPRRVVTATRSPCHSSVKMIPDETEAHTELSGISHHLPGMKGQHLYSNMPGWDGYQCPSHPGNACTLPPLPALPDSCRASATAQADEQPGKAILFWRRRTKRIWSDRGVPSNTRHSQPCKGHKRCPFPCNGSAVQAQAQPKQKVMAPQVFKALQQLLLPPFRNIKKITSYFHIVSLRFTL